MKKRIFEKIGLQVHDRIRDHAETFVTIYTLSQEFSIGEQKLKAGFQKLYQQTIWDYANQVRMNRAAVLLKDPEKHCRISLTGYPESGGFFGKMFKKWSGTTRGRFRPLSERKARKILQAGTHYFLQWAPASGLSLYGFVMTSSGMTKRCTGDRIRNDPEAVQSVVSIRPGVMILKAGLSCP